MIYLGPFLFFFLKKLTFLKALQIGRVGPVCEFEWMPRAGLFFMSAVVFSCLQSIAVAEFVWFHVQIAILKLRTLRKISTLSLQKLKLTGQDGVTYLAV